MNRLILIYTPNPEAFNQLFLVTKFFCEKPGF